MAAIRSALYFMFLAPPDNPGSNAGCPLAAMLAAKRSAHVVPGVDLRECTLHLPPQKVNKAELTMALKPRGDVTRNPKQGCQWPQKL